MKQETLNKLNLCEDYERECKLANGGLPESIWETYSSFANTNGGTILLGIREHRDSFTIEGLTDKQIIKYQKDFWSTLNDRNKTRLGGRPSSCTHRRPWGISPSASDRS